MSQYTSSYPDVSFAPAFRDFFENFYRISDTPDAHEQYTEFFTEDATLIMASRKAQGREEILALRKGLWAVIGKRSHKPLKVFPFGENSNEVMIYGTVEYETKSGSELEVDWAARANLVESGGAVKMNFYQVYLDTGAQSK